MCVLEGKPSEPRTGIRGGAKGVASASASSPRAALGSLSLSRRRARKKKHRKTEEYREEKSRRDGGPRQHRAHLWKHSGALRICGRSRPRRHGFHHPFGHRTWSARGSRLGPGAFASKRRILPPPGVTLNPREKNEEKNTCGHGTSSVSLPSCIVTRPCDA